MKLWSLFVFLCMVAASAAGYYYWTEQHPVSIVSPLGVTSTKPLDAFTVDALSRRTFEAGLLVLDGEPEKTKDTSRYRFHYMSDGKKVTGIAYMPADASADRKKPVIIQFRGYVDPEIYVPGTGTEHSAEVFAQNGFISLAPDFLGYGGSDDLSGNIFQDRFETYTTALNLLHSVQSVPFADHTRIGIWGHSNGGQIAITISEISNGKYPIVLWAPVTKPFPYSILYYTDDADDHGKYLRKELADFEKNYDVEQFSLTNYLDRLQGPVQIHQGTSDEAVPQKWSDVFAEQLKETNSEVSYYVYPGADHDMKGSWNLVMNRTIDFFKATMK